MPYKPGIDFDTIPADYVIVKDEETVAAYGCKPGLKDFYGEADVDDDKIIQNAIDVLENGGKIFLSSNEFKINYGIRIKSNIEIEGTKGTKLAVVKTRAFASEEKIGTGVFEAYLRNFDTEKGNENITIKNLTITQEKESDDARLSTFRGVNNLLIENVNFATGYVANLELKKSYQEKLNQNIVIRNCSFNSTIHPGVDNIHIGDSINASLEGCIITGSKDISIDVAGFLENIKIKDCTIENNYSSGIFIEVTDHCRNVEICRNIIQNNNGDGIHIEPGSEDSVDNVIIDSCTISNCFRGIRVVQGKNIRITRCLIEKSEWMGVELDSANNVILSECIIRNNGKSGYKFGIYLQPSTKNLHIANCIIYDDEGIQQWAIETGGFEDENSTVVGCIFYGHTVGNIHGHKAFGCCIANTGAIGMPEFPTNCTKVLSSVEIGGQAYSTPLTIKPHSSRIVYFDAAIEVTAGAGEIITVKIQTTSKTSSTNYIEKTLDNSSGTTATSKTFELSAEDKAALWFAENEIRQIDIFAKSSLATPSSSAAVNVKVVTGG